jgi:hypothetical protein
MSNCALTKNFKSNRTVIFLRKINPIFTKYERKQRLKKKMKHTYLYLKTVCILVKIFISRIVDIYHYLMVPMISIPFKKIETI